MTIQKLWEVFVKEDALLVEVNPLVRTPDDQILALDGKVTLDANADFRQPGHAEFEDKDATDPLELKAKENDLNYVKLDGEVGIIGNGAGLVMSTLDVVAYAGEKHGGVKPANFLDIGGGASAAVMAAGLDVILNDAQVKSVFVNVFGGITACDAVANGIVKALEILGDEANKPLVVRLDGNNVDEGRRILAEANHPLVTVVATMDEAADKRPNSPSQRSKGTHRTMAIFLTKDSKVIVQGITGGEGTKHTALMLKAGTQVVGGVNARKAGTTVSHTDKDGNPVELPVFGSVAEAMKETAPTSRSRSFPRPSRRTPSSRPSTRRSRCSWSSPRASRCRTPPTLGRTTSRRATRPASSAPTAPASSPRVRRSSASPRRTSPASPVGLVSKSGTLTYQMMFELREYGFSTAIGIGGDPVIGTTHIDAIEAFEKDPETKVIVMIGEIGGDARSARPITSRPT